MMNKSKLLELLKSAKHPEDIFGTDLISTFREYAKMLHPDTHPGDKAAEDGFKMLAIMKGIADGKVEAGTYGDRTAIGKPIVLKAKNTTVTVTELVAHGDICQVYGGTTDKGMRVAVKIARNPANNDLAANESAMLRFLRKESPSKKLPVMQYIPEIIDFYTLAQGKVNKQVVILQRMEHYVSIADVIAAFPDGLPLADAAWMWNRLLAALIASHQAGVVHGAVTPDHVFIRPQDHNGILIDWSYSVKQGQAIKAVCPAHRGLYPFEILNKAAATFGADLYMAANILSALVTGDATAKKVPKVPRAVLCLLRSCWLGPTHRPQDAFELFEDFSRILFDNFGKPKFRPFSMPEPKAAA